MEANNNVLTPADIEWVRDYILHPTDEQLAEQIKMAEHERERNDKIARMILSRG